MYIKKIIFVGLAGFMLSACESDKSETLQDSLTTDNTVDTISNYDLGESVIPFPNDFLFAGSVDGTLNIPLKGDPSDAPLIAMNALDGFSTVAPMTTGFTDAIDGSSISGDTVRVYPITKGDGLAGPATAVAAPLVFGVDYVAALSSVDTTNSTLAILPLKPLAPKSSYAVVITNGLKSASGRAVGISGSYFLTSRDDEDPVYNLAILPVLDPAVTPDELTEQDFLDALNAGSLTTQQLIDAVLVDSLKPSAEATNEEVAEDAFSALSLELLRFVIVKPTEDAIIAADSSVASADIILHWTFTTQSTSDVMAATRVQVRTPVQNAVMDVAATISSPLGAAVVHFGILDVPYYLKVSDTTSSPSNDPTALGSCWEGAGAGGLGNCAAGPHVTQFNPAPTLRSIETIPLLVTVPDTSGGACGGATPVDGWPVVIFQHGITRNRGHLLAVSDSIALGCMAAVAIDIPMHGVAGTETDGTAALRVPGLERHFDLDLVTQNAEGNVTAAEPDGVIDSSGTHFVNLTNLVNTRDNLRQAVSDLFVLVDAIEEGSVNDGANSFDEAKISYYGFSLGGIAGTVFVAMEPNVGDAVLAVTGTSVVKIMDGSFNFGPALHAGLAANGIVKGTADYESFLGAAQTVVDSGDSVNFATAAAQGRGILFFEIVGGNSSPSDLTVPNVVPDANDTTGTVPAPLAGSEAQIALMGLTHVNTDQLPDGGKLKVVTKYISGEHGSLIDPSIDPEVTSEMQSQAATFFASSGTFLDVTNDTVLQAP